jgi:acetyl esterase/lipase
MVVTKSKPDYTPEDPNFKPGKNSHLSVLDPDFASLKSTIDPLIEDVWKPSLSLEEFRKLWLNDQTPPPGCPVEGEDVVSETRMIPMRDGHKIEIKIYRKKDDDRTKALMMRYHGGGWVVGGHCTEKAEDLLIAGRTNTVVVSVDYRM